MNYRRFLCAAAVSLAMTLAAGPTAAAPDRLGYARQGDRAAIRQLAAEMLPILQAVGVHPDALAALLLFQRAAEADEVTLNLLDQIAALVRRVHGRSGR